MSSSSKKEVAAAPAAPKSLESDIMKYKGAADIVHDVMKKLVESAVEGANVFDLVVEGDKNIEAGAATVYNKKTKNGVVSKGIAFPTCISVNNVVAHFSPLQSDPASSLVLAKGDVVKIHLGAHIDGYAATSAETLIVGATEQEPAEGRAADAVKAAYLSAEAALRSIKAGERNYSVTEVINKITAEFDCKPVENMVSCSYEQNKIDGKKQIILGPADAQKKDVPSFAFGENEVYGMDVLVTTAEDGKTKSGDARTTIYQRMSEVTYQLKLKTSRAVFSEVQSKAGAFPFNIRSLEDEKRSRVGLQEAVQHNLIREYDVQYTPAGTIVAAFHFTIAILPGGPWLVTQPPVWYKPEKLKTSKELEAEDLKALVVRPLREKKLKKKQAAPAEGEEA